MESKRRRKFATRVVFTTMLTGLALNTGAAAIEQVAPTDLTASTCDIVRTNQFDDPGALVAEYVRRVEDGQFLSRWEGVGNHPGPQWTAWLRSAVLCPARLAPIRSVAPAVIIARYSVGEPKRSGDGAVVTILYDELGSLNGGVFREARQRHSVDIIVQRTPWGWRVTDPDSTQWVSVSAAMSGIHLSNETQRLLQDALKR